MSTNSHVPETASVQALLFRKEPNLYSAFQALDICSKKGACKIRYHLALFLVNEYLRIVAINIFLIEYMLTRQEERGLQKCYRQSCLQRA